MKVWSRRWLWSLVLIPLLIGGARLRFDVEVLNLLPSDSRAVQGLKLYQENFSNARELIISVKATDADTTETAARTIGETLRAATNLTAETTWQAPWLEHPNEAAELIAHLWINQPPQIFGVLTNQLRGTNALATLKTTQRQLATSLSPYEVARLSYDPFNMMAIPGETSGSSVAFGQGQELFSSSDGMFRLIYVQALDDLRSYTACRAWLKAIRAQVEAARLAHHLPDDLVVSYTGRPAFVTEIAGGMERDITGSVAGTLVIIALLFWLAHRSWRPLLWLLALLLTILAGTFALGGLLFGAINVVSAGFAAILLGLTVDYALIIYQEHKATPRASAREIRRAVGPSILWSAVTTAGAFLVLNWGGLPGLSQLGSLVAIGIALGATLMLFGFLPPLIRAEATANILRSVPSRQSPVPPALGSRSLPWAVTGLILFVSVLALSHGWPKLDHSANALRHRNSSAYAALEELKSRMGQTQEPLWLIMAGKSADEVAQRLDHVHSVLARAASNKSIASFTLPTQLWPRSANQIANRPIARALLADEKDLRQSALAQGFTSNALAVTETIFATWRRATDATNLFWPDGSVSHWIFEKLTARTPSQFLALGLVYPALESTPSASFPDPSKRSSTVQRSDWTAELPPDGVWLAGWEQLGRAILDVVQRDLSRVLVPTILLVLISLGLAFRRITDVVLSLATLAFSGICLLVVMTWAGWSWNLLNLMALPLLLGAGVDYSIHMQLALRRHHGNLSLARSTVGRALVLCAATTVAGFGSLAWSSNAGLASLGQVCSTGIALTAFTSIYLLPAWWRGATKNESQSAITTSHKPERDRTAMSKSPSSKPSSLYRTEIWRLGLMAVKHLSPATRGHLSHLLSTAYWSLATHRREVIIQNLLPALDGNRLESEHRAKELVRQFGKKVADLWCYESGLPIDHLFLESTGWEHFEAAQRRNRGTLLLTPHLGNWEFGAPWLAQRGVKLLVITLAEPHSNLTGLRQASRARWGVDTLVIGENPFAFVEVIRRLEAGATIALLVDRPLPASAVTVELFGRPFAASIAAAELARASGCALLPVYLPRSDQGYSAHILPEIPYDRQVLAKREARHQLTQEIMRVFEPVIKQYITQWYHFVPIWPRTSE